MVLTSIRVYIKRRVDHAASKDTLKAGMTRLSTLGIEFAKNVGEDDTSISCTREGIW
jgi:hypothetical protein